jgi:hypothetical protein
MSINDVNRKIAEQRKAQYLTPEVQTYLSQGRLGLPSENDWLKASEKDLAAHFNSQLSTLKDEDKRIKNYYELSTGQAATPEVMAQYYQYASDPALLQAAIGKKAATMGAQGTYNDTISSTIKEKLGRDATEAEKQYFGKQMEAGNLDLYGLGTFMEGTNEFQSKALDTGRTKLASELAGTDQTYLDKVSKQLQAQYSAQGRSGAGAYGSALIEAGKDLATQRTGYLSGLAYGDLQRGVGNLRADYEAGLARQYAAQQQGAALGQESRQRYYGQQDYNRQTAGQERLLRLQNSMNRANQPTFAQALVPGLVGGAFQLGAAKLGQPQNNFY